MMFTESVFHNLNDDWEVFTVKEGGSYKVLSSKAFLEKLSSIQTSIADLRCNDRVVICMENRPEWIASLFAVFFKGAVAVPLDYMLSEEEIFNVLRDCQPRCVITSSENFGKVDKAASSMGYPVKVINVDQIDKASTSIEFVNRNPDDLALILYTSGTTGNPKGVMLTFKNLNHNVEAVRKLGFLDERDRFLAILPFHHTYPLLTTAILPLALKMHLVFLEKLTPSDILETIREQKVTILVGVPKLYHVIYHNIMIEISRLPERKRKLVMALLSLFRRAPLKSVSRIVFSEVHRKIGKSLRFMISGGAKLSVEVAKGLEAFGFTVLEGYGLTETSPLVSVNTPENRRIGSVGLPIDGVEVKVENGEILVKGDNVMRGYYNKPEETEKVIKDGWFYTGDLGYVKEGFIYVTGRAKEVIVLENGKNVYPEDIENEILRSKYILEVGVFEEKGVIKSIVRPNFDLLIEKNVKDIVHFVKKEVNEMTKHLQPYKRVREIVITDRELPRTRIGKLRRFLLPELYKELKSVKKTSNISTV